MSILTISKSNSAINVTFDSSKMMLFLADGSESSVPLEWFPQLRNATIDQLNK